MGPTMRPASHRIAAHLPAERSLEEVILARKLTASAELQFANSRYERYTSAGGEPGPQRGTLASPSSPASFLSHLPSEAYTREVSSRVGRHRRGKALRRATPEQAAHRGGTSGEGFGLSQQHLRPLTGVSPPSTAQSAFRPADYAFESLRPTTSNRSPKRGDGAAAWGFHGTDGADNSDSDLDTNDRVVFLTDKCNALARRLQQVEAQLLKERPGGKKLLEEATASSFSQSAESFCNKDNCYSSPQPPGSRASTADARSSSRNSRGSSRASSQAPSAVAFGGHGGRSGRKNSMSEGDLEKRAGAYSTPRTTSSKIGHDSRTHNPATPLGRGKLNAHYEHNNDAHLSPGQGRGIMVPPDVVKAIKEGDKPRKNGGVKMDADALHCEIVEKEIAERFEVVAGGIETLENVFSGAAQILEHRVRAITTISSVIRMFLQRCRYLRGKEALRAWRTSNSLRVLQCMRHEVFRQKKIEAGLERLRNRRHLWLLSKMFRMWSTVIGSNEQRNYQLKMFEERVKRRQLFDLTRNVFHELKDQTIGPSSSRELARKGLRRQQEARERVVKRAVARGELGLYVTDAMVRQEMSRQAVELMRGKVEVNLCRSVLTRLQQAVVLRKKREVAARAHFRRWASRQVMRVIKGWRKWAALKAEGMDRKLMTGYRGGERLRYNTHKVAAFTRRREMVGVFLAWSRKSAQLAIATRMQRKKLTEVVMGALDTWKAETKKSKQVKKIAVGMWADFSLKDLGEPFRMWYIYADYSKKQTKEHERLLQLHRRYKNRRKTHIILKAWKHLAVYGRIEGMYTRSQLMSSLAEQKDHTLRLVGKVDELAGGLGDMEELAMEYRSQMIMRQRETTEREDGMDRQTMALHHAEQEVVRLQCLLASAADVAPQVCQAIHKVAPGFDFKERGLQPFTDARAEALEMETEQRVQELVAQRMALQQAAAANSHEHAGGRLAGAPNSARGMDPSNADGNSSEGSARKGQAAAAPVVITADAKTQAWLPADPEAAARAAVAAAALAQASDTHLSGIEPPILPKELARLDRVEWVLRRTSVAEVGTRLKAQREEEEAERDERGDGGPGRGGQGRKGGRGVGGLGGDGSGRIEIHGNVCGGGSTSSGSLAGEVGAGADDAGKAKSGTDTNGGGGGVSPATVSSDVSFPSPTGAAVAAVATATVAPPGPDGMSAGRRAAAPSTGAAVEDDEEGEEDDGEEDDVADRLAGIFEFLRSGNPLLLPPDLRVDWEARPDLGLGLLAGDDHADDVVRRFHPAPSASWSKSAAADGAKNSSSPKSGSPKSGRSAGSSYSLTGGGSGKGTSTWVRGLCRESSIGSGEPMTYHDLRLALTASTPKGRLTETTNDMLERRLAERRSRADEMAAAMWGNDRPQFVENLYRSKS
ncbi:unnamed protein product [Ectocarpus fasciculatus]